MKARSLGWITLVCLGLVSTGAVQASQSSFRAAFLPAFELATARLGVLSVTPDQRENAIVLASANLSADGVPSSPVLETLAEEQALLLLSGAVSTPAAPTSRQASPSTPQPPVAHHTDERAHCSDGKCSDARALGACAQDAATVLHHTDERAHCSDGKCSDARALGNCNING